MNFAPTEAQTAFAARIRDFATTQLRPGVRAREQEHRIPPELIRAMGREGLLGVNLPTELGGVQLGSIGYAMAIREITTVDAAVGVTMAVTNMVGEVINHFGSLPQRQRHVPRLADGTYFGGAFGLSEAGAGSDAASLTTRAERRGSGWRLNGQKMWITSGDMAGVMVVWARTGEAGANGISCFLVEGGTPGMSFGKPEEKMGLRASHTVSVSFQDVDLPEENLLGNLGEGFKIAMTALNGGRIGIGAQATAIASAALSLSLSHVVRTHGVDNAHGRETILNKLADMAVSVDAGWLLTLRAAWLKELGRPFRCEAAMAKMLASEGANACVREAMQIFGEYGALEESGVARLVRDCRVTQIYEGTSEIQRLVISRDVLKNG